MVQAYAVPQTGSVAIDRAAAAHMSSEDILGRPRAGLADVGAYEVQGDEQPVALSVHPLAPRKGVRKRSPIRPLDTRVVELVRPDSIPKSGPGAKSRRGHLDVPVAGRFRRHLYRVLRPRCPAAQQGQRNLRGHHRAIGYSR